MYVRNLANHFSTVDFYGADFKQIILPFSHKAQCKSTRENYFYKSHENYKNLMLIVPVS